MIKSKETLYFIHGLPSRGKSTFANLLADSLGIPCFESDDYFVDSFGKYTFDVNKLDRAHKDCKFKAKDYLSHGESCIVSNTITTENEVKVYQDIADLFDAAFVSLIVENRHGGKSVHDVPEVNIQRMKDRFSICL